MATIRKRGKGYQIDYFDPGGKRIRKSFKKKKDAEAELAKRMSLIAENRYLDIKKEYKTTFGELAEKYKENHRHQSYYKMKRIFIKRALKYFGDKTLLTNIKYVDLETYRNHLRQQLTMRGTIRKNATVNRDVACVRHMFTKAVEWDMIEQNPFNKGKSLLIKENNQRVRYLEMDEIESLLDECIPYIKNIVECALNTGMRKGEILSLKWYQIRNGFIYLTKTKTSEPRQIPINETLDEMFKRIKSEQNPSRNVVGLDGKPAKGSKSGYVFRKKDKPVRFITNIFNDSVKRAGIFDFRFHDLRHTFASQLIMKGGSLKDVQELLGHKTMPMTLRYAHLSQEHKRKTVNLLNGLTSRKKDDCHKSVTKKYHHCNILTLLIFILYFICMVVIFVFRNHFVSGMR